jgi:hypothetical protein
VDTSGSYQSRSGKELKFGGVRDLATYLAQSEESHGAFVEQLFQHMVKQPVQAYGPYTLPELRSAFADNAFNIRRQLVETVTAAAVARPAAPEPGRRAGR